MSKKLRILLIGIFSLLAFVVIVESCKKDDDEPDTEICNNGIDDDGDGYTDASDPDCQEQDCSDATDNDGDGFIDCDDTDCSTQTGC